MKHRRRRYKFKRKFIVFSLLMVCVLFFCGALLIPSVRSDFVAKFYDAKKATINWVLSTTSSFGFQVKHVEISGLKYTTTAEVLRHLNIHNSENILFLDTSVCVADLMNLGWVEHVKVQKKLPDTVVIHLTEYEPYAIWQFKQKLSIITETGVVIPRARPEDFRYLPLIIGEKANVFAKNLLSVLNEYGSFKDMIVSAHYVHNRRWRLYFSSNVVVELPEGNLVKTLDMLHYLNQTQKILDRDVEIIDMRVPNKLIFKSFRANKKQKI